MDSHVTILLYSNTQSNVFGVCLLGNTYTNTQSNVFGVCLLGNTYCNTRSNVFGVCLLGNTYSNTQSNVFGVCLLGNTYSNTQSKVFSVCLLGNTTNLEGSVGSRITCPTRTLLHTSHLLPSMGNSSSFITFGRPSTIQYHVSVVTVLLCTLCLGNVHEPLSSKMGSSTSGSSIAAFRRRFPSRCLATNAWLRLHYCDFHASSLRLFVPNSLTVYYRSLSVTQRVPPSTFECLNQFSRNSACVSWQLSPCQRPTS
jgi:hypothetical protein